MLVQQIAQVPDDLFFQAKEEIDNIKWDAIIDPRAKTAVFSTSKAIHIRIHRPPKDKPMPTSVDEWSAIVETIDNPHEIDKYPNIMQLVDWIYKTVNGVRLGRVMIVKVEPGGEVDPHIDPLTYFEVHSRFHVPVKTNLNVIFHNGDNNIGEHMPYQSLCRLNNRIKHAMINGGVEDRIHLIVDIETPNGNQIF